MNGATVYMSFLHQDKQTGGIAHQRTQKPFLGYIPLMDHTNACRHETENTVEGTNMTLRPVAVLPKHIQSR